jgi:NADH dehydrogenase (ubiquinone) Fe-S protein 5
VVEAEQPSDCKHLQEDYLECLHHRKEIVRENTIERERAKEKERQLEEKKQYMRDYAFPEKYRRIIRGERGEQQEQRNDDR